MGAWGFGPFDNDAGMDFVGNLRDDPTNARSRLAAPLRALTGGASDPLPVPTQPPARRRGLLRRRNDWAEPVDDRLPIDEALAAAAIVAIALGAPEDVNVERAFVDSLHLGVDAELRHLALTAIERSFVASPRNDWLDGWEEAGSVAQVRSALAPYEAVLRG